MMTTIAELMVLRPSLERMRSYSSSYLIFKIRQFALTNLTHDYQNTSSLNLTKQYQRTTYKPTHYLGNKRNFHFHNFTILIKQKLGQKTKRRKLSSSVWCIFKHLKHIGMIFSSYSSYYICFSYLFISLFYPFPHC